MCAQLPLLLAHMFRRYGFKKVSVAENKVCSTIKVVVVRQDKEDLFMACHVGKRPCTGFPSWLITKDVILPERMESLVHSSQTCTKLRLPC